MNRKHTPNPSKTDLYRDYRREAGILDFSWRTQRQQMRQQRREKFWRRLFRLLLAAGLAFLLWLAKR